MSSRNGKSNHGDKTDPAPSRRGFLSILGAAPGSTMLASLSSRAVMRSSYIPGTASSALKGVAGTAMLTALDAPSALAASSTDQQDRAHLPMPNTGKPA
jgi:hypothetical protein